MRGIDVKDDDDDTNLCELQNKLQIQMKLEVNNIKLYNKIHFIEDNFENGAYLIEHATPCVYI